MLWSSSNVVSRWGNKWLSKLSSPVALFLLLDEVRDEDVRWSYLCILHFPLTSSSLSHSLSFYDWFQLAAGAVSWLFFVRNLVVQCHLHCVARWGQQPVWHVLELSSAWRPRLPGRLLQGAANVLQCGRGQLAFGIIEQQQQQQQHSPLPFVTKNSRKSKNAKGFPPFAGSVSQWVTLPSSSSSSLAAATGSEWCRKRQQAASTVHKQTHTGDTWCECGGRRGRDKRGQRRK